MCSNNKMFYLNFTKMTNNELESDIRRKKKQLADFMRIAEVLHFSTEERNKRIDMLLDDLSKLLKKRNN